MPSTDQLHELVKEFVGKVPSLKTPKFSEYHANRIVTERPLSSDWLTGVYYFSVGNEIKYVGQGTSRWGVGYRVREGLGRANKPEWDKMLTDPECKVGIYEFDPSDWYWPCALEQFLIWALRRNL